MTTVHHVGCCQCCCRCFKTTRWALRCDYDWLIVLTQANQFVRSISDGWRHVDNSTERQRRPCCLPAGEQTLMTCSVTHTHTHTHTEMDHVNITDRCRAASLISQCHHWFRGHWSLISQCHHWLQRSLVINQCHHWLQMSLVIDQSVSSLAAEVTGHCPACPAGDLTYMTSTVSDCAFPVAGCRLCDSLPATRCQLASTLTVFHNHLTTTVSLCFPSLPS